VKKFHLITSVGKRIIMAILVKDGSDVKRWKDFSYPNNILSCIAI